MRARRLLRRLLRVLLVLALLLLIGVALFAWTVHISDPLNKGETADVPQRTMGDDGRWHVGRNWLSRDSIGLHEAYIEGEALERVSMRCPAASRAC